MESGPPLLTLVIPAYNERARIEPTLETVGKYLEWREYESEVLVVDDGSRDGTAERAEVFANFVPGLRVLRNPGNRGKGYSVRHGMREGRGRYLVFSDADLSTPIEETEKVLRSLRRGADVAVASRRLAASEIAVKQPPHREIMGRGFNILVQALAVRGILDTQCGFKGFRREAARALFPRCRIDRFGFDVEILYLARKLGLAVAEVPVRWVDSPDSRVDPLRDPVRMFAEILRVRMNDWRGLYRGEEPADWRL